MFPDDVYERSVDIISKPKYLDDADYSMMKLIYR